MSVTSLNGIQNAVTAVSLNSGISITTAGQELNFNALSGGVTSIIADGQSTAGDINLVGAGTTTITNDGNNTITITSTGSGGGTSISNGTPPNSGSVSIDATGNVSCNNSAAVGANQNFEAGNNFQVVAGNLVSMAGSSIELSDTVGGISMIPSFNGGLQIIQQNGASLIMEGGAGVMTSTATDGTNTSQLSLGNLDGLGYSTLAGNQQMTVTSQARVDVSSPLIVLGPASGSACAIQLNGTVTATSLTTLEFVSQTGQTFTNGTSTGPYSEIQNFGSNVIIGTEGGFAGDFVELRAQNVGATSPFSSVVVSNGSDGTAGSGNWVFTRTNLYLNGVKVLGP